MKKNNNKGFMLVELLVTTTIICTVLIGLYTQFSSVKKSYDKSFKYNTVNNLYTLASVRNFLMGDSIYILKQNLLLNNYIDLTNNDNTSVLVDNNYFATLLTKANIKTLFFTKENLTDLIENLDDLPDEYEELKKFIRYIDYDPNGNLYRLIAEYTDNTYASILIEGE